MAAWRGSPYPHLLFGLGFALVCQFGCYELVEHWQEPLDFAALDLVVEEVHIVKELVALILRHVATIAACHYENGSEFAGRLLGTKAVDALEYDRQGVIYDIAIAKEFGEFLRHGKIGIKHPFLIHAQEKQEFLLGDSARKLLRHDPEEGMGEDYAVFGGVVVEYVVFGSVAFVPPLLQSINLLLAEFFQILYVHDDIR